MNTHPSDLEVRLDAIRRRIRTGREAVAAGDDIDLSALGDEISDVSQALRAAPLQIDREAVAGELTDILADLNQLHRELSRMHAARGGQVEPEDEAGI